MLKRYNMKRDNQIDMTNGNILLKLLAFSLPIIFSGILQLLFNTADIIIVGKFVGKEALAAVGSTSSLINLLYGLFFGLSIGTTVVAANFLGAKKPKEVSTTVHTSMLISFFSGIGLTIVGTIFAKPILQLMKTPSDVIELASLYLKIYFSGITVTMIYNFGSALLRAKGDTRRPLYILFLSGILNVILNIFFVIHLKLGVTGVGIATVISQTIAAIFIIIILLNEKDEFKLNIKKLAIDQHILYKIIKVGVPAGFQSMMFSFSNVIIQSSVNSFGTIVVAGNSAAQSVEGFVYTAMNGFAQGTLTFVSQNYGAQKYDRIKSVSIISQFLVIVIGLILGISVIIFSEPILSLYTNSAQSILAGKTRIYIICSLYFLCGNMDVIGYTLRGIGHSLLPMVATLAGACGLRLLWIATIFQINKFHSIQTIYLSYPISWFLTFLTEMICFIFIFKKMNLSLKADKLNLH